MALQGGILAADLTSFSNHVGTYNCTGIIVLREMTSSTSQVDLKEDEVMGLDGSEHNLVFKQMACVKKINKKEEEVALLRQGVQLDLGYEVDVAGLLRLCADG